MGLRRDVHVADGPAQEPGGRKR